MVDGWIESKASLLIQNVILLCINAIGVWRWYPKAEPFIIAFTATVSTRLIA